MATQNFKDVKKEEQVDGIGIVRFFQRKELLITGATGFLAKVLVEKILREVPDVGKIYLVMRASNAGAAMQRLKTEIINTELFKLLQKAYGDSYDAFMLSKLVPVAGNMCDSDLGIEPDLASHISNKIHVIIGVAANTTFNERYDVAIKTNVNGPCNLVAFAKRCKQFKLFLHVSTAYVSGERVGNIMEKPFRVGDSIAREKYFQGQHSAPTCSSRIPPILDVGHEVQLAVESFSNDSSAKEMKDLGMIRAKKFGWNSTYQFTKAMGEMMIDSVREDIPVVIVRPAIVESTLNDPFPGWIQGYKALDPLITNYGRGKIPGFAVDPTVVIDMIPVDMVANVILAAIAKHGSIVHELGEDIKVYHVGTSTRNPIMFRDVFRMLYEHFHSHPYIEPINGIAIKVSPFQMLESLEAFSNTLRRHMTSLHPNKNMSNKLEIIFNESVNRFENMAELYEYYMFYHGRFDITNTEKLMEGMSAEEKEKFNIDVRTVDWKHYIKNVHIPGVRRHIMMKVRIEPKM